MRPNLLLVRAYLTRGAWLWLLTRLFIAVAILFARQDPTLASLNPVALSPTGAAQVIVLSVAACFLDTHRHRERALLGNLGVRPFTLVALFVAPALLGEIGVALAAAGLR